MGWQTKRSVASTSVGGAFAHPYPEFNLFADTEERRLIPSFRIPPSPHPLFGTAVMQLLTGVMHAVRPRAPACSLWSVAFHLRAGASFPSAVAALPALLKRLQLWFVVCRHPRYLPSRPRVKIGNSPIEGDGGQYPSIDGGPHPEAKDPRPAAGMVAALPTRSRREDAAHSVTGDFSSGRLWNCGEAKA